MDDSTLILSDLHLGSKTCNIDLLEEVFQREKFDRLILNGDTINNVNFRKLTTRHWALLDKIREAGRSRELVLIRGNHDHECDHLICQQTSSNKETSGNKGLTTGFLLPAVLDVPMVEEYQLQVKGQTYLVLHGDRFDPTLNYRMVTEAAFLAYQFTTKLSHKLAKWLKKKSKRWGGILELVRSQSVAYSREQGYSGVITGHTHFAEDTRIDDVHYVNTGSWTETPCAYVTADSRGLMLHHVSD